MVYQPCMGITSYRCKGTVSPEDLAKLVAQAEADRNKVHRPFPSSFLTLLLVIMISSVAVHYRSTPHPAFSICAFSLQAHLVLSCNWQKYLLSSNGA